MDIEYSKSSLKFLAKLDKKSVDRIKEAIDKLTVEPPEGDIKPLKGYKDGRLRLKLGGWRIIFRYDKNGEIKILYIIDIGIRGDIYK